MGYKVEVATDVSTAHGCAGICSHTSKIIILDENLTKEEAIAVLAHELGHVTLMVHDRANTLKRMYEALIKESWQAYATEEYSAWHYADEIMDWFDARDTEEYQSARAKRLEELEQIVSNKRAQYEVLHKIYGNDYLDYLKDKNKDLLKAWRKYYGDDLV